MWLLCYLPDKLFVGFLFFIYLLCQSQICQKEPLFSAVGLLLNTVHRPRCIYSLCPLISFFTSIPLIILDSLRNLEEAWTLRFLVESYPILLYLSLCCFFCPCWNTAVRMNEQPWVWRVDRRGLAASQCRGLSSRSPGFLASSGRVCFSGTWQCIAGAMPLIWTEATASVPAATSVCSPNATAS